MNPVDEGIVALWDWAHDKLPSHWFAGDEEKAVFVVGLFVCIFATYMTYGCILLVLDITHKPERLYEYKIQGTRHFDTSKIVSLFRVLFTNFIFVMIPLGFFVYHTRDWETRCTYYFLFLFAFRLVCCIS